MCKCEKCGEPCACGERYCDQCFIDELQTDAEKNLYTGGRFYGEEWKSSLKQQPDQR